MHMLSHAFFKWILNVKSGVYFKSNIFYEYILSQ